MIKKPVKDQNKRRILGIVLIILAVLFAFIIMILNIRLIALSIIVLASAIVQYLTHRYELKFDLGHVFFIALLISKTGQGAVSIFFILAAGLLPRLLVGAVDEVILAVYPVQVVIIILSTFLTGINLYLFGIGFSLLAYFLILLIGSEIVDVPVIRMLDDVAVPLVLTIVYFISFADPMLGLVNSIF